ncbi:MAG: SRPBCC family protein [Chitinophagaceae bacterium]|nr:SRPBCC family protein [Chitinophagaceae bacterium]
MNSIHLTTFIQAPVDRVFDLSRNITVYKVTLQHTRHNFSSGSASSLIGLGDTLTFRAKHLGKTRIMTAKVINLKKPDSFVEEQVNGDLRRFRHEHHFMQAENGTIMIDMLDFEGPTDWFGKLLGKFYLKKYLQKFIQKRNEVIKQYAESEKWRAVLS